jgi:hypothetical protein
MNRLEQLFEEPAGESPGGDYFVVSGEFGFFFVDAGTAARVERELDRRKRPRWLVVTDLTGSRVRVRTRDVRSVCESTAAQRARDRALHRARRLEEKADRRPWEEED